jgi:GT2 family glycosyltransferase
MDSTARISIVVITRNREAELIETIKCIHLLPEKPPVIVVDNGSTDGTLARVRRLARVVALGRNLGAAARQIGLEHTTTPYVAFADDDVHWRAGSLSHAIQVLDRYPRVAVLAAKVLVGDQQSVDDTCIDMANSPLPMASEAPGTRVLGFLAGASVVRRAPLLDSMGTVPRQILIGGEEEWIAVDLAARGWHVSYIPEIIASHYPSKSRDSKQRQQLLTRNAIWFALLRRPLKSAIPRSLSIVASACRYGSGLTPCAAAIARMPFMLGQRRVVPREVEIELRMLDEYKKRQAIALNGSRS